MHLPTRGTRAATLFFFVIALALAGCFGGSEDGEVAIISEQQTADGGSNGAGIGSGAADQDGEVPSDELASVSNEDELLDIIGQAEGSGANPDNRTGAPSTFPSTGCPPNDEPLTIFDFNILAPAGQLRSALGCLRPFDLSLVTVTAPGGDVFDRFWTEGLFDLNFSLFDESGPYEVSVQRRQASTLNTNYELDPFERLVLQPLRSEEGWVLAITGYGTEPSVRVAVYAHAGNGAPNTALAYNGSLGEIALDGDGITLVGLNTGEDFLCFYVDAADEDRFPQSTSGCFYTPTLQAYYQPGDSALAQSLTDALTNNDAMAIGAVMAPIDESRGAAVATIINRTSGEPLGAAVFEGQLTSDAEPRLAAAEVVSRDDDSDFTIAFQKMCEAAAGAYPVIGNPCLRAVELPPTVVFELIKVIDLDLTSTLMATDQEAITDCLPYNSKNLSVTDEGDSGWLLTDGVSGMAQLDTKQDAATALEVAQYHSQHCFVGRSNGRADRDAYVTDFWLGGKPGGPELSGEDCISYDPATLKLVDLGAAGWQLSDGRSSMLTLDSKLDAQKALNTAAGFTAQCFLGRNNSRDDRSRYVFQYWK